MACQAAGRAALVEGKVLLLAGKIVSAASAFYRAHREAPESASALHELGNALLSLGRADEAFECAFEAHLRQADSAVLQSNLLQTALYAPGQSPASVADIHRQWGERHGARSTARRSISRYRRLRVGYVSMNFCVSPDAFFLEPVIQNHDPDSFEVYCYANVAGDDWRTERFRRFAHHWQSIRANTAEQTAAQIEADEIDVLVECSGHFADSAIGVFCLHPAAVQVGFPIYPATTGLPDIRYRITDAVVDPPERTDSWHAETLVRLPGVFTCYMPHSGAPEVGELPADRNEYISFGCFNRLHKVNDAVLDAFAEILLRTPGARLLFHHAYAGLHDVPEELAAYMRERFEKRGVDSSRVSFIGARMLEEHLMLYNEVDIALDTFPYAGMTTTCDSLWMGVPVVTLAGAAHVSRVGASRLTVLGLEDWIAADAESYVRIAAQKARDVAELRDLRRGLRERMRASPITDALRYTRNLEAAYRSILGSEGQAK